MKQNTSVRHLIQSYPRFHPTSKQWSKREEEEKKKTDLLVQTKEKKDLLVQTKKMDNGLEDQQAERKNMPVKNTKKYGVL